MEKLIIWLTPVWVLSLGILAGAIVILLLYVVLWLASRRAAADMARVVRESVLGWISYVVLLFSAFAIVSAPLMPVRQVAHSIKRMRHVGVKEISQKIPAHTDDYEVPIGILPEELQSYSFTSDQNLIIDAVQGAAYSNPLVMVQAGEPYIWTPNSKLPRKFDQPVSELYVTNQSPDREATLTVRITTDIPLVEAWQIPITAAAVAGVYVVYLLINWLLSGVSTIAQATAKEAIAQPLYLLLMLIGLLLLVGYIYIPYNTFGEDVKMYKDAGMMTILALAVLMALWTASLSVAEEIEGRTALTLLSKPISRRQFVIGKFLGIVWPVFLMFVLLGLWMMICASYKVVYDARETSYPDPAWQACSGEMVGCVPGLVLAFMEAVVLASISVAISTRLSMLPNLVIVGAIYVLGHLGPLIVQSSVGQNEFVAFFGQLIALVFPVLDHFNIQAAVAGGVHVPPDYLAWALLYCVLYSTVAMLLALILFEDRDLA